MRHLFSGSFTLILFLSISLQAAPSPTFGKRLVQISDTQIGWLEQSQLDRLSEINHSMGRCAGYMDVTETIAREKTLGTVRESTANLAFRELHQQRGAKIVLPELRAENLLSVVKTLSETFPSRYYRTESGVKSSQWIFDQFSFLSAGRTDVKVTSYKHTWAQPSVIAMIQGRNPALAVEAVVIGAHQDSTAPDKEHAPGADDDASGVATILEIFRALMQTQFRPERSVYFIAYAGEEAGLLGSQVIAQEFKAKQIPIAGVMQFDMTSYPGNPDRSMGLMTDYVNEDLTTFTKKLIDTYVGVPWTASSCGYGCSDHASWHRAGYKAAFPAESTFQNSNHKIHTNRDTIADGKLDFNFGLHFAKLGAAFVLELATEPRF